MDTLGRFPRVWCHTCQKIQRMIFDVMPSLAALSLLVGRPSRAERPASRRQGAERVPRYSRQSRQVEGSRPLIVPVDPGTPPPSERYLNSPAANDAGCVTSPWPTSNPPRMARAGFAWT